MQILLNYIHTYIQIHYYSLFIYKKANPPLTKKYADKKIINMITALP